MVRGIEQPSFAACKGQSSRSIEDERQTELAVEVEVDSRVCRRQSVRPVTVGTEGRNRGVDGPTPSLSEVMSDSRH